MASQLERILSADYLGDLRARPMDELRSMRAECQEIETGLSFLRRLVQGRLDIVGVEQQRRREGGAPGDLSTLVSRLPEILSDRTRAPGTGRLPQFMAPGDADLDDELAGRLDAIVAGHDVETLPSLTDDEVERIRVELDELERDVSERRRQLFDRIDALQAEITRRYRTGEASVESLLQ